MSQGAYNVPTGGSISMVSFAALMNAAYDALASANSGASAPANGPGNAPLEFQTWFDTTNVNLPVFRLFDGVNWDRIGTLDIVNSLWIPQLGGGFATLTAASTTDLGATPQCAITIIGTTTINSFGTSAKNGEMKLVYANAAFTITNSSNIICPQGKSIKTAVGDTFLATYSGSNQWTVALYVRSSSQNSGLNILDFGGKGDNSTDNSTPLTNALNALTGEGGSIYFPAGKYKFNTAVSFNLPAGIFSVSLLGAGQDATELTWPNAAGGITLNHNGANSSSHIRDMTFSTGIASGGAAITLALAASIVNPGIAATTDIYRVTLRGADGYLVTDYWTTGLNISNVSDVQIDNLSVAGSSTQQGIGTNIVGLPGSSTYAVEIDIAKSNYFGLNTGIVYNSFVQGVTVDQTNFTFVTNGIISNASETGALVQLAITNSQFNPGTVSAGVGISTGTEIGGLQIINNFFVIGGPNQTGISVPRAEHYAIIGNQIQGLNSNTSIGISIGVRVSGAPGMISHNDIYGFSTAGIGIKLLNTSLSALVDSNVFANNATNISNLGTSNIIRNNPGYNPVGISAAVTMGASPFSYTAGASPETHYINQNPSGTAVGSKSGIQIISIQANISTYYIIELEPNESYSITWATTAPTYTKDVH